MAGPSVMVRVLGDVSGLGKSFQSAGSAASSAASKMSSAFKGVLGALNQTGVLGPFGDALNSVDQAMQQISEHGKDVGTGMMAAGATIVGLGVTLSTFGSKEKQSQQQLAQAISNTGHSYDEYGGRIDAAIKHQEKFGDSAVETRQALQILTQATGDPTKALNLLSEATDLAAAKHEGLAQAALQLGKVYNGNTKLLKEFGIQATAVTTLQKQLTADTTKAQTADKAWATAKQKLSDLETIQHAKSKLTVADNIALRNAEQAVVSAANNSRDAHQKLTAAQAAVAAATSGHGTAVAQLAAKLKGQGAAAADTFQGHMRAVKTEIEDQVSLFGEKYGPAITKLGGVLTGVGAILKIVQAAQSLLTTTTSTAAAASDAAAATQAAASATATAAVEAEQLAFDGLAASEVAAESAGLPLIATVGLIVLAVVALIAVAYVIYRNWTTIWSAMKDATMAVWDWIKTNWPLLLAIITGPIGIAVYEVIQNWDTIKDAVMGVISWIANNWPKILAIITGPVGIAVYEVIQNWQSIVSFFTGLPATFAHIFGLVANAITSPFRDAFNAVASFWNSTVGSLSFTVPSWIPGVGGKGFSVPKIPTLDQGGIITKTGLILAHAGEAVTPAPAVARGSGPLLHIEHASFQREVDADLMSRRLAWLVQTHKV